MALHSSAKVSKEKMSALITKIVQGISDSFEKEISSLKSRRTAESKSYLLWKRKRPM